MRTILVAMLAACLPVPGFAAPAIEVSAAWARAMPPVAKTSAGYLVIRNRGDAADTLEGASVDGVRVTELHEMVHEGAAMTMRRRTAVEVPAGGEVAFAPGGLHLMLIDLQRPLQPGEQRQATLVFREAGPVTVILEVRGP